MSSLKFCLRVGGTDTKSKNRGSEANINWTMDMSHVDRLNMDRRHRAGFTYRLSRIKPRASEKIGGFIANNEDFFSLH